MRNNVNSANTLISVVIVCKNSSKTIEKTFESVLVQDFDLFEVVVIDGKSEDSTIGIIKKYAEKFVERNIYFSYVSEKDNGIYDAMNKGSTKASGEYIIFLNSDDWLYSRDVFSEVSKKLLKENVDVLYGNSELVWKDGKHYTQISKNIRKQIYARMPFIHQAVFTKRSIIIENLFDAKLKLAADYDFFFKVFLQGKNFKKIDTIIVNYSMEGSSNKHTNNKISKNEYKLIQFRILKNYPFFSIHRRKYRLYYFIYKIRRFFSNNKFLKRHYILFKQEKR